MPDTTITVVLQPKVCVRFDGDSIEIPLGTVVYSTQEVAAIDPSRHGDMVRLIDGWTSQATRDLANAMRRKSVRDNLDVAIMRGLVEALSGSWRPLRRHRS